MDASYASIKQYVQQQYKEAKFEIKNNLETIRFNDEIKKGYLTFGTLHFPIINSEDEKLTEDTLIVTRTKYTAQDNLLIDYSPSPSYQCVVLMFYFCSDSLKEIFEEVTEYPSGHYLLITNTAIARRLYVPAHTEVSMLSIHIPLKILQHVLTKSDSPLLEFVNFSTPKFRHKYMTTQMKQSFEDTMNNPTETLIDKLEANEKLSHLIKLAFEQYYLLEVSNHKPNLKKSDIDALIRAERVLTSDITQAPSISVLAHEAAMSTTKFKKAFKAFYNKSVYQYYLYYTMELAREMITKEEMTVSQTAQELGYKNMSHFSRLFKKHFGVYPSKQNLYKS
ncbi:MAG: AraC family transcriptional regulator [Spirosomataceae bacterium]